MRLINKLRIVFGYWPKFEISIERKNEILDALNFGKPGDMVGVSQEEMDWLIFTRNGSLQEPKRTK